MFRAHLSASPFTHVVSLGGSCRVAYNVRRFFDFRTAYPFDWWVTSTVGLTSLIRNFDIDLLYQPDALVLDWQDTSVQNRHLGIWLHHEFPREWSRPGQPVVGHFRDLIEQPRRRTEHLVRRFSALNRRGERLLFVREMPREETDGAGEAELIASLVARFCEAEIALLLVNGRGEAEQDWITTVKIPDRDTRDWRGDIDAWQRALAATGAILTAGLHRPAETEDLDAHSAANRFDAQDEISPGATIQNTGIK